MKKQKYVLRNFWIFLIILFLFVVSSVYAGDPRIISLTMTPPSPTFGDRITVTVVFCGATYQRPEIALAISTVSVPSDARISGLGQTFIISHAGYDVDTPVPASAPGGDIGYSLVTPTGSLLNCSTCGQTSTDGQLITVTFGDATTGALTVPGADYFTSCNPQNLYLHVVMKNNSFGDGDFNQSSLCPQSLTWSIPTLPPAVSIHKNVEGTVQIANDLVLFSIDYTYSNGHPVITDAIPNLPGGATSWTLVSSGPSGFYTGPSAGSAVTPGQMMSWTLPDRTGLKGTGEGTVWFLLKVNGTPAKGAVINNTANAVMGPLTDSSSTSLVAGQPAITIEKSQSMNQVNLLDTITYYLQYGINGSQLVAYQSFDELTAGVFGNPSAATGGTAAPAGWSFMPNKSEGSWTIEDTCGTGDKSIRGDTTQNDDYPGLLYTAYPMTGTAQCLGTLMTEVKIDPAGSVQGNGYEGADALVIIRSDGNGSNAKAYGLVLSVDDYIGTNSSGNIGFQKCVGSTCSWPKSVNTLQVTGNKWYHVKIQTGPTSCDFSAKVWAKGDPEPSGWTITWSDTSCSTDSMDCETSGKTWYSGVAEQGGANAATQDSYNNFLLLKPRVAANTTLYDTIPVDIKYLGQHGPKAVAIIPGNMVAWDLGNIYDEGGTYTWWGQVIGCGPVTNVGAIDGADPIYPILSNETVLDVYCGTPTCTPTSTPTPTVTATRTYTPTYTATPTYTFTYTNTPTPTFTDTATPTCTYTATPTYTPTYTMTPTYTYTDTKTVTPTSTDTYTPTPTFTSTDTKTYTPTSTDTYTATPTFTWTNTKTDTPTATATYTFSATLTFTDTISSNTPTVTGTFTMTFTATPTYTCTDTQTVTFTCTNTAASNTPTATRTFTGTRTSTQTSTDTPTGTATPTYTDSVSSTPTYTYTNTDTATMTATPTFTCTFTKTDTPTITWTPTVAATLPPFPYRLTAGVYNEAGELVKLLIDTQASAIMNGVDFKISGAEGEGMLAGNSTLQIYMAGVETPSTIGQGGAYFYWDGKTSAGQLAASGSYYIKLEEVDVYGHVNTLVHEISLLQAQPYVELDIYNSAGEFVYSHREADIQPSGKIVLGIPDKIILKATGNNDVTIVFGPGLNDFMAWNGMNSFGTAVSSGIYELRIVSKNKYGKIIEAGKTVQIFRETGNFIENIIVAPNPYKGLKSGITFWWGKSATGSAALYLYNIAGELARTLNGKLEDGGLIWDAEAQNGRNVSDGLYIYVLVAKNEYGYIQKKTGKIAVLRNLK